MSIDELFEGLVDFLSGIFNPAIDVVLDFLTSSFGAVFSWIFSFISGDFMKTISDSGILFFDTVSGSLASSMSNGQFIYFVIGALISFPLLKIVINIIRG